MEIVESVRAQEVVRFLRARIDEDKRMYSSNAGPEDSWESQRKSPNYDEGFILGLCLQGLCEVEVKRRILDWYEAELACFPISGSAAPSVAILLDVLAAMTLPYASHADYHPEWAADLPDGPDK